MSWWDHTRYFFEKVPFLMINLEGDSEGLLSDRKVLGEAMYAHASQSCSLSPSPVAAPWCLGKLGARPLRDPRPSPV